MADRRRDEEPVVTPGQSDDGETAGFELLDPSDPDYPTPEQLLGTKGFAAGEVRRLTDEEVEALERRGELLVESAVPRPKRRGLWLLK
jgi:hypothetical protein